MFNIILKYQNALKRICNEFEKDEKIMAIVVFGSMVTGDLWEGSDIDIILIIDKDLDKIKNLYAEEDGVSLHIKAISKKHFLEIDKNLNCGIYKDIISSKLLFSKDNEITDKLNRMRYFIEADEEKISLGYLNRLLKDIKVCKKYIANGDKYTAFSVVIRCVDNFSKLFVINKGYRVNKDAVAVSLNLNDEWKIVVDDLFFGEINREQSIKDTLDYIDRYLTLNLKKSSKFLLDLLKELNGFVSFEDIKNHMIFKDSNIAVDEILEVLAQNGIISIDKRLMEGIKETSLIKEKVYFYRGI